MVEGHAMLVERELDMTVVEKGIGTRIFSNLKLMVA
jgi:hypothetical protein